MKKYLILLSAAVAALLACGKTNPDPEEEPVSPASIVYSLDATFSSGEEPATAASTKAVKTGWENGDAIFVFSDKAAPPLYLKMTYSNGVWSYSEPNGAMPLANGSTGTFRAVYLPFGNNAAVSKETISTTVGESTTTRDVFQFDKTYETLYWTATLNYTVTNGTVSGNFNMVVPDGYVQLWIEDSNASAEGYKVATDALQPVGVIGVETNGDLYLNVKIAGANLPGYPYQGGYLFGGKLVSPYNYGNNYYFAKTKTSDESRADYFISNKMMSSHKSIKLPANNSSKWVARSSSVTVPMKKKVGNETKDYGNWYACNYGASKPEDMGTRLTFSGASNLVTSTNRLATKDELDGMTTNLTWIPMAIHRKTGVIAVSDTGFIFFPDMQGAPNETYYWGVEKDSSHGYTLQVNSTGGHTVGYSLKDYSHQVRFIKVPTQPAQ